MTQFDVFATPSPSVRAAYPFVVILQADVSANRVETVVAPIAPRVKVPAAGGRLLPLVSFNDREYVVLTSAMTTMPSADLKRKVANLVQFRARLLDAIDLLFSGV